MVGLTILSEEGNFVLRDTNPVIDTLTALLPEPSSSVLVGLGFAAVALSRRRR